MLLMQEAGGTDISVWGDVFVISATSRLACKQSHLPEPYGGSGGDAEKRARRSRPQEIGVVSAAVAKLDGGPTYRCVARIAASQR